MSQLSNSEWDKWEKDLSRQVSQFKIAARQALQLEFPEEIDEFIKRCLRTKDFNQEKALKLFQQFPVVANEIAKLKSPFRPSPYDALFRKISFSLDKRDRAGRRIILTTFDNWDPSETLHDEIVLSTITLFQYAMTEHLDAQREGVVYIVDCSGFTAHRAWNLNMKLSISFMTLVQKGVVGRLKAIHVIFHPRIVSVVYAAIKPFLSEKMQQRVIFHGDDLSSLHKHIEPSCLPLRLRDSSCRNASYDNIEEIRDKEFHEGLLQQDQFFQTWIERGFPSR